MARLGAKDNRGASDSRRARETRAAGAGSPAKWSLKTLLEQLSGRVRLEADLEGMRLSERRVTFEVEKDPECREILERWQVMDGPERMGAWERLVRRGREAAASPSAECIRCGDCCRRTSPTLHPEDLLLVRGEKIPLRALVTLRTGEPVYSPFDERPYYLTGERIKVRTKPGTNECVFLGASGESCGIYRDRPAQCRAQSCWNPEASLALSGHPSLDRRKLFEGLDMLVDLFDEHDRRCSFAALREVFDKLEKSRGENVDEVVDAVAFEDHFRSFAAEKLGLPAVALELFFGRSFSNLVRLFGFRVEETPDGSRVLVPDCGASGQSSE